MKVKAIISYDGRNYCGFQRQPRGGSVQDALEKALAYLVGESVKITGAGRTDAGVSARGQVIAFEVNGFPRGAKEFKRALNRLLPNDIFCTELSPAPSDFHPRRDALAKVYSYRFSYLDRNPLEPFVSPIAVPSFDVDSYISSIKAFRGRHDFRNFTTKTSDRFDFMREIYVIDVEALPQGTVLTTFIGNGFMTYMVRLMIGAALKVASKRLDEKAVLAKLDATDKSPLTFKALPQGLILERVIYDSADLSEAIADYPSNCVYSPTLSRC